MLEIKSDLHLHTRDDREDNIAHSAKKLISHAARKGFKALAITNHNTFTFSHELQHTAEDHGILLIPGIEKTIERKHVVILNAFPATEKIDTFSELRNAKADGLFLIAPHPFFKARNCLGRKLYRNLDIFDAVEFSFFYSKWFNLNREALTLAQQEDLPVVGNSDCHLLKYMGVCHSIVRAEELSMEAVFSAIRENHVEVVSSPISFPKLFQIYTEMKLSEFKIGLQPQEQPLPVFTPDQEIEKVCA